MNAKRTPCALLLRHGSTVLNAKKAYRSRLDPSLDKAGFAQAEDAADYIFDHYDVSKISASPMLRTCQTAEAVAEKFNLEIVQDRALFPWHLGFLGGKDKATYEPILNVYIDNPKMEIPDGESLDKFEQRVKSFIVPELKSASTSGKIYLFVTHTSAIITIGNTLDETAKGRPEVGESSVEPGGIMVVYKTPKGYAMEPAFGEEEKNAEFGS